MIKARLIHWFTPDSVLDITFCITGSLSNNLWDSETLQDRMAESKARGTT